MGDLQSLVCEDIIDCFGCFSEDYLSFFKMHSGDWVLFGAGLKLRFFGRESSLKEAAKRYFKKNPSENLFYYVRLPFEPPQNIREAVVLEIKEYLADS